MLLGSQMNDSSMINLHVDELLEDMRLDYSILSASAERIIQKLKATIDTFPTREPLPVCVNLD